MLSFGDEVEEEENEVATSVQAKIKSIHDVLDDPRFLKGEPEDEQLVSFISCDEKMVRIILTIKQTFAGEHAMLKTRRQYPIQLATKLSRTFDVCHISTHTILALFSSLFVFRSHLFSAHYFKGV